MKKELTFLRTVALSVLFGVATTVDAKDVYLSATGDDTNSGFTADAPVKSFITAYNKIPTGEESTIYISGFIQPGNGPTADPIQLFNNRKITFQGTNRDTDGFDGQDENRLLECRLGSFNATDKYAFKNLTFKNGKSTGNGHRAAGIALRYISATFEDCVFTGNTTYHNGATGTAVFIQSDMATEQEVTFRNCIFKDNIYDSVTGTDGAGANSGINNANGTAISLQGGAKIVIENCLFEENKGSGVGAVYFCQRQNTDVKVLNSTFIANESTYKGSAINVVVDANNLTCNAFIDRCTFLENMAVNGQYAGLGCVFLDNNKTGGITGWTVANSTFYANKGDGNGLYVNREFSGTGELLILNSTFTAGFNGCPITFNDATANAMIKKIYNTVIEANSYNENNLYSPRALYFHNNGATTSNTLISNSYISHVRLNNGVTFEGLETNYASNNHFMYDNTENKTVHLALPTDVSSYIAKLNAIPVSGDALTYGDPAFFADLSLDTDQLGYKRGTTTCAVGALEGNPMPTVTGTNDITVSGYWKDAATIFDGLNVEAIRGVTMSNAVFPASISGLFSNNKSLCYVVFDNIPAGIENAFEGVNENCLIYLPEGTTEVPTTGYNYIVNGSTPTAFTNITLFDSEIAADENDNVLRPFYCPIEFELGEYTATYNRTLLNYANGKNGWMTLALPFNGTLYADEEVKAPYASSTDPDGTFWLKKHAIEGSETTVNFEFTSAIEANVPYLVALPGSIFGTASLENKEITVRTSGNGAKVMATNDPASLIDNKGDYDFVCNYQPIQSTEYYVLTNGVDEAADTFVKYDEPVGILPFRAYIQSVDGGNRTRSLSIGGDGSTTGFGDAAMASTSKLLVYSQNGTLCIQSQEEAMVSIYSLDGILIKNITVMAGTTPINGLTAGVYLVNGQKVIL